MYKHDEVLNNLKLYFDGSWILLNFEEGELCNSENGIFLLSTGLTDKDGVEIFEGDIINQTNDFNNINGNIFEKITVVRYNKKYASFTTHDIDYDESIEVLFSHAQAYSFGGWIVIGNIYENPEILMEVEK